MVLSLDTDVTTPPDPLPWAGAIAIPIPKSLLKHEDTARLSGIIININKVINLFIRYKT